MTIDPLALAPEVDLATARLMATVANMPQESLAQPSLLPGWTRGHVLSHLARNADALNNLLIWASTGVETPAYASVAARDAGIAQGAHRSLGEQIADLRASSDRFATSITSVPASAWAVVLGAHGPAAKVVWRRLREVEVHHVDLGLAYTSADWPTAFALRLLTEVVTDRPRASGLLPSLGIHADELGHPLLLGAGSPSTTVSGPAHLLALWLSGRSDGTTLSVSPAGRLPELSNWM